MEIKKQTKKSLCSEDKNNDRMPPQTWKKKKKWIIGIFNECRNIDFGINRFPPPPTHEISVILSSNHPHNVRCLLEVFSTSRLTGNIKDNPKYLQCICSRR